MPRRHTRWSLALAALVLACGGGSNDATGPGGGGGAQALALGDTVQATLDSATGTLRFEVPIPTDTQVVLLAQSYQADLLVRFYVKATNELLSSALIPVNPAPAALGAVRIIGPRFVPAGALVVTVARSLAVPQNTFRMAVLPVATGPEVASAALLPGDTLAGERFEHVGDIDMYDLQAPAGSTVALFYAFPQQATVEIGAPATVVLVGSLADASPGRLLRQRTAHFVMPPSGKVWVRVTADVGTPTGPYRLFPYLVNRAPEHHAATVALGDTITGESLETIADIDEYSVSIPSPGQAIAYLGNPGPSAGQPIHMSWMGSGNSYMDAGPAVLALDSLPSLPFDVQPGTLSLRVEGPLTPPGGPVAALPYQAQVRAIVTTPETASPALVMDDTLVTESLDYPGDVDIYQVGAQAGQRFNAFVQAGAGRGGSLVLLDAFEGITQLGLRAISTVGDTALSDHATGAFTVPQDGTLRLVVSTQGSGKAPYRLFLYPVDTLPELVPALVQQGDTVTGETIEYPGDEDHFQLVRPTAPGALTVFFAPPATGRPSTYVVLTTDPQGIACSAGQPTPCSTGRIFAPADTLPVTVTGDGRNRTAYSLYSYPTDLSVEAGATALPIGGSVSGTFEVPGDIDTYALDYIAGTQLELRFASDVAARAWITDSLGTNFYVAADFGRPSLRFDLPKSGRYQVRAGKIFTGLTDVGPFTLELDTVPSLPEAAAPVLVPDAPASTEAIDFLGDLDQFTVTAAPGTEFQVLTDFQTSFGFPQLQVFVPGDSQPFKVGDVHGSGRWLMPAGGTAAIRMAEPRTQSVSAPDGTYFGLVGYTVQVRAIHRAPEVGSAVVTVQDTLRDGIDFFGDVDEYSVTLAQGQQFRLALTLSAPWGATQGTAELLDPTGTTVLATVQAVPPTGTHLSPQVTIPAAGTYRIRIQSVTDVDGQGPYVMTFEP